MPTGWLIRRGMVLGVCLVVLAAGCSRRGGSDLAPVSGKVCFQGRPLHTGVVVFAPDPARGTSGEIARGEIQADGTYRLKSGDLLGIVPGWHRVTVIALEDVASGSAVPRSLLPHKYRDPELSGLNCEVTAGRENTINFNLQ